MTSLTDNNNNSNNNSLSEGELRGNIRLLGNEFVMDVGGEEGLRTLLRRRRTMNCWEQNDKYGNEMEDVNQNALKKIGDKKNIGNIVSAMVDALKESEKKQMKINNDKTTLNDLMKTKEGINAQNLPENRWDAKKKPAGIYNDRIKQMIMAGFSKWLEIVPPQRDKNNRAALDLFLCFGAAFFSMDQGADPAADEAKKNYEAWYEKNITQEWDKLYNERKARYLELDGQKIAYVKQKWDEKSNEPYDTRANPWKRHTMDYELQVKDTLAREFDGKFDELKKKEKESDEYKKWKDAEGLYWIAPKENSWGKMLEDEMITQLSEEQKNFLMGSVWLEEGNPKMGKYDYYTNLCLYMNHKRNDKKRLKIYDKIATEVKKKYCGTNMMGAWKTDKDNCGKKDRDNNNRRTDGVDAEFDKWLDSKDPSKEKTSYGLGVVGMMGMPGSSLVPPDAALHGRGKRRKTRRKSKRRKSKRRKSTKKKRRRKRKRTKKKRRRRRR